MRTGVVAVLTRFSTIERWTHWIYALLFVVLVVTAVLMIASPWSRSIAIGPTRVIPMIHSVAGAMLAIVAVVPAFRHIVRASRGADSCGIRPLAMAVHHEMNDVVRRALSPRNLDRFNAGQRANIAFSIVSLGLLAITGAAIWLGRAVPYWIQEPMYELHVLMAIASVIVLFGHVALAILNPEAMRGIIRGTVSRAWADRHHRKWVDFVEPMPRDQ